MQTETFENVFAALYDAPEQVAELTAKAELVVHISERVQAWGVTPKEAAHRLSLTRPRLEALLRGKLAGFSRAELTQIAALVE